MFYIKLALPQLFPQARVFSSIQVKKSLLFFLLPEVTKPLAKGITLFKMFFLPDCMRRIPIFHLNCLN